MTVDYSDQAALPQTRRFYAALCCSVFAAPGIVAGFVSGTARADSPTAVLEEIVVTSQKRSESLQNVPVAVTAFQQSELESFGFADPASLTAQTPNFRVTSSNGQSKPNVFIRGIGSTDFNASASAAVGFYTDEVYQGLQAGQLFQMFDLERVEVLRGPQGILYGRNTTGGAVNFFSRRPSGEFAYNLAVTYGRFNQFDVEGGIEFPIAEDKLAARIAGTFRSTDGDTINLFTNQREQKFDAWALRSVVKFTPTDNQEWILNIHGGRYKGDGEDYHFLRVDNGRYPDGVLPLIGVVPPYAETGGYWTGSWNTAGREDNKAFGGSLSGTIDFDGVTLTTITGYEKVETFHRFDSDASPLNYVNVVYSDDNWQFSQELRLTSAGESRFKWIIGGYFYTDRVETDNDFDIGRFARELFGAVPDFSDPSAPLDIGQQYVQKTKSFAMFGSASYDVTAALKLSAGLRWTYDKKSYSYHTFANEAATIGIIPLIDVDLKNNWDAFTGNVIADYRITDDAMVYASYNRGFKSGAYNGSPFFDAAAVEAVDPEYVDAFEVGLKTRLFSNRATFNLAGFYNDFRDLQVFRFVSDPMTGIPTSFLQNAAAATIKGIEVEFQAKPTKHFYFQIAGSYLDAKFKDYIYQEDDPLTPGDERIDFSGNTMVSAPKWTLTGFAEYRLPAGDAHEITPRFEFTYLDDMYFDQDNDPLMSQKSYWVLNASIGFEHADGRYGITAWVRNLSNTKFNSMILGLSDFGLNLAVRGDRRTYGLTLRYKFN